MRRAIARPVEGIADRMPATKGTVPRLDADPGEQGSSRLGDSFARRTSHLLCRFWRRAV